MDAAVSASQPRVDAWRWLDRIGPARLVAAILVVALAVRAIGLGMRPLWLDEAYSAWFSARSWAYLWTVVPTYEPHPPFYYSILKLWRGLFGGDSIALRGFSVLCSLATVPVVFAAASEMERQRPTGRPLLGAGVAAFLSACSPMLIVLDQEARPYPLLILAYAVAVLGLLRLIREFAEGSAGTWGSWLLLAGGTEVVLWAHGLGAIYAGCLALALLPAWLARPLASGRIVRGLTAAVAVALAYLPCLIMILRRTGDWGTGWLSWDPSMLLQLFGLYSVPGEALTVGSAVAAIAMLFLIKRAIQAAVEEPGWNADRALLILWLGPPLAAVILSTLVIPIFLPRALAATLVPAYLAIGFAIARTPARMERVALTAAIVITLLPTAVQVALRQPMERWDAVGTYLSTHVKPGDQVWLYPNDSALPLAAAGFHGGRGIPGNYPAVGYKGPIRAGSPAVVSVTREQAAAIVSGSRSTATIWLVTRQRDIFDPAKDMTTALGRVRRGGVPQEWGYIAVQPFYARRSN